jgi:riboflavin kinase/FMN adenylyltransferase
MQIHLSLENLPSSLKTPTALAIGMFDGVHSGHHKLLSHLKACSSHTTVLTFTNHPREIVSQGPAPLLLTDSFVKSSLFQMHGIDTLILIPFTKKIAALSYDDFLSLLLKKIFISDFVQGEGDAFGKNREGTFEKITSFGNKQGITTHFIPKLFIEKTPVSSSHIRNLIQEGNFTVAEAFLGKPYLLSIEAHKQKINASHLCLPPDGFYQFFSESKEPIILQIQSDLKARWILLPKAYSAPTLITSTLIEEFYKHHV